MGLSQTSWLVSDITLSGNPSISNDTIRSEDDKDAVSSTIGHITRTLGF